MQSKLALIFINLICLNGIAIAQVPPAAGPTASTPLASSNLSAPANKELPAFLAPFNYDPRGRRDPFVPPAVDRPLSQGVVRGPFLPLQRFDLDKLKLTGIIWDVMHPKAMITDPEGKVHIVGPNTKIGKNNGYIAVIREGEVVVVETSEDEGHLLSSSRVIRLAN
jgi:type IV pilus assembly protein PilP